MLHIMNSRRLALVEQEEQMQAIRSLLSAAGIEYVVRIYARKFTEDEQYFYYIYVNRADHDRATALLAEARRQAAAARRQAAEHPYTLSAPDALQEPEPGNAK